jgi:GNAT superfamily N-acetyltransferase
MAQEQIAGGRAATALIFRDADAGDAEGLAALLAEAAQTLTALHGTGPWSRASSPESVGRAIAEGRMILAEDGDRPVGMLRLRARRPFAIDIGRFSPARAPIYLVDMAVRPDRQRRGVGRAMLAVAIDEALAMGRDAIRLDAYDAAAGAGPFYRNCGFAPRGGAIYRRVPLAYFERLL